MTSSRLTWPPRDSCRQPSPRSPILSRPAQELNPRNPFPFSAIQYFGDPTTLHQYDCDVVRELSLPPESAHSGTPWQLQRSHGTPYYNPETSSFSTTTTPSNNAALTHQTPRPRTQNLLARHGLPASLPPPPRTTYTSSVPHLEVNIETLDKLLTSQYRAMRQDNPSAVASTPVAPSAPLPSGESRDYASPGSSERLLTRRSPADEVDLLDTFMDPNFFEDFDLPAPAPEAAQAGPNLWEISPDETPLDTPDDHFGDPNVDVDVDGLFPGMPLFGAEFKNADSENAAVPSGIATDAVDESFTIDDLMELAAQYTPAPPPSYVTAPFNESKPCVAPARAPSVPPPSQNLTIPSLDDAPYVMPPTPVFPPTTLHPDHTLLLRPGVPVFPPQSSVSNHDRLVKPLPTGVRKNITLDKLVPLDAPTQPRNYSSESATSRKVVPAAFRKKRGISEISDAVTPDDEEAISDKRRKNTLAARKSRQRKLETMTQLQQEVMTLTQDRDMWMQRAYKAEETLRRHGIPVPHTT